MRVNDQMEGRIVGHITVKIASQVVSVPVEAAPLGISDPSGFVADGSNGFRIVIDSQSSEVKQRETIERGTVEAARYLSRRFLN